MVEAMRDDGEAMPRAVEDGGDPADYDRTGLHAPHAIMVSVEMPDKQDYDRTGLHAPHAIMVSVEMPDKRE